ncbi:flagellar export chaperone FliS [Chitinispirillales bacterium ANBcel5]|uniref:flagellar export chaperone FliS n=1 Tax=Cellulosispirillum alkaliphilum TaxID=3039283 RepID=UPI002A5443F8|nr:flagellar export chaperone FliS [Chitinispirillales bacterium ANBcel5]
MKQGYSAYKNTSVDTADQGKLIIIAYDVAIKHSKLALEKFDDYRLLEERTNHMFKVQDAITELVSSLNLEVGEVAINLYKLYDYMLRTLVDASVKSKKEKLVEVLGYLETLRSAWAEASLKVKTQAASRKESSGLTVRG